MAGFWIGAVLCIVADGTKAPAIGCRTGDVIKFGNADGGCTFDNKFPAMLGTLATETPGDGSKDVEDDMLLRDSKNQNKGDVYKLTAGIQNITSFFASSW